MKHIKKFFAFSLILALVFINCISVCAIETGFSIRELSDEEYENFISNVDICLITREPNKKAVSCFDVNEQGLLVVGCEDSEYKTVCIYSNGDFLYGYEFYSTGSFGVEWDNENLNIYFVRSDVIVCVNESADIIDICKVENTSENNTYYNNYFLSTKKTVSGTEYKLKKDMGILNVITPKYSMVIAVSQDDVETVIYEEDVDYGTSIIVNFALVIVFLAIVAFGVIIYFRRTTY